MCVHVLCVYVCMCVHVWREGGRERGKGEGGREREV